MSKRKKASTSDTDQPAKSKPKLRCTKSSKYSAPSTAKSVLNWDQASVSTHPEAIKFVQDVDSYKQSLSKANEATLPEITSLKSEFAKECTKAVQRARKLCLRTFQNDETIMVSIFHEELSSIFEKRLDVLLKKQQPIGSNGRHVDMQGSFVKSNPDELISPPVLFLEAKSTNKADAHWALAKQLSHEYAHIVDYFEDQSNSQLTWPILCLTLNDKFLTVQIVVPVPSHKLNQYPIRNRPHDITNPITFGLAILVSKIFICDSGIEPEVAHSMSATFYAIGKFLQRLKKIIPSHLSHQSTTFPKELLDLPPLIPELTNYTFEKRIANVTLWKWSKETPHPGVTKWVCKDFTYMFRDKKCFKRLFMHHVSKLGLVTESDKRRPLPKELQQTLTEEHSQIYAQWNTVSLAGGMICFQLYPFIEGEHVPRSAKQFQELMDVIKVVHDAGYVHGDVLPRNVVFPTDPELKTCLIDFDLCRPNQSPYVSGYNNDIEPFRHVDAKPDQFMLPAHDHYAIMQMAKLWFDLGAETRSYIDELNYDAFRQHFSSDTPLLACQNDDTDGTSSPDRLPQQAQN